MNDTDNLTLEQRLELLREQHRIIACDLAKIEGAMETVESIIAQVRRDQQRRAEETAKLLEAFRSEPPKSEVITGPAPVEMATNKEVGPKKKRATLRPNK